MEDILFSIVKDLLSLLITVVVGLAINYLKHKLGTEKMNKISAEFESKKEIVAIGVKYIQQNYGHLDSNDKYTLVADWIVKMCKEKGLKVSEGEVKGLIESVLIEIKKEFKDDWKKASKDNEGVE